jgi:hypothetical protein
MNTPDEVTGPINIGNPSELSVRALAELIIEKTGAKAGIEFRDLPADDPKQRQPDIGRARELLGWEPRVSLDTGLDRTIAYFCDLNGEAAKASANRLERAKGFEPSTPTLARLCSTPELRPLSTAWAAWKLRSPAAGWRAPSMASAPAASVPGIAL